MTQRFLMVPTANLDVNNQPTTLTGAVLDDATVAGLTNGTAYRAFALNVFSGAFTPASAANIAVVGDVLTATSFDGTVNVQRTLTPTASILENDIIVVIRGRQDGSAIDQTLSYNNLVNLRPTDGRIRVDWLRAGSTPPTSIVVPAEASATTVPVTIAVVILRGVNTTTTFDVTETTASSSGNHTLAASSITPVTNGAFILCAAVYNDRDVAMDAYPANLDLINTVVGGGAGGTTINNTLAIGAHRQVTAGVFSPGTWDFGGVQSEGIVTITMAFRPA